MSSSVGKDDIPDIMGNHQPVYIISYPLVNVYIRYNYGKSPFEMGNPTISMAIFNSYVTNYQRV